MARVNWRAIAEGAASKNRLARKHSIYQAVTELEKALTASGVDCGRERLKRKSLADMFLDLVEREQDLQDRISKSEIPQEAFANLLRRSIDARNKGIHSDEDVDEAHCEWFAEVIQTACQFLRERFVTRESAAYFARLLLNASAIGIADFSDPKPVLARQPVFSEVFLYGSLARHSNQPKDIDLLLVDVFGSFAPIDSGYSLEPGEKEKEIFKSLDRLAGGSKAEFSTERNLKAIDCAWLNLTVIDATFGRDSDTTLETAAVQSDPLFFLNVATEMLRFEPSQQCWVRDFGSVPIFAELAKLRSQLTQLGIAPRASDELQQQQGEHEITVPVTADTMARIDLLRRNELSRFSAHEKDRVPHLGLRSRATMVQWAMERGLMAMSNMRRNRK